MDKEPYTTIIPATRQPVVSAAGKFRDIVDLAVQLCNKQIALIVLFDQQIAWIEAASGASCNGGSSNCFSRADVEHETIMVIPDISEERGFAAHPLCTYFPGMHFYAGIPLVSDTDNILGMLCLLDIRANSLTSLQQQTALMLARHGSSVLQLELNRKQLASQAEDINAKNESFRKIAYLQSHEIRQPLTSIIGLVNLVKQGYHSPDDQWLDMISEATGQLDHEIHAIVKESLASNDLKLIRFNSMVQEIDDYAILLLDTTGLIENWNRGAERINGYSAAEILGRNFSAFYTERDRAANLPGRMIARAARDGVCRKEGWRVRKDGSKFWAKVVITAIRNDSGQVIGFIKVTRDLTDVKQAQHSCDAIEAQYKSMIDEIEDYAIILLDARGRIEKWNKGAERINGYEAQEIIGRNFSIFYDREDQLNRLPELFLEKARRKGRVHYEGWRVRKDGSKFWGTVTLTAIHNGSGKLLGFVKATKEIREVDDSGEAL